MNRVNSILGHMAQRPALAANPTAGKKPMVVTVTGAAGNIAYSIIFMICHGEMLGTDQPIELRLLDIPASAKKMEGVVMEIKDCAFPLVTSITATTDYQTAFSGCEIAMLVGARPRGPGMVRADLLKANGGIFKGQGAALDKYASRNIKIVVVGNPCNTNALVAMKNAPSLPKTAFTAMTRLDENRAYAQIADKLNVPLSAMKGLGVYGNHSITQYPSVRHATVNGKPMRAAINDDQWLETTFLTTNQQRGAAIIKARGGSSAASAAKSAVDHMRDWVMGTPEGTVSSMGVLSDGNPYGVPSDLIYSFPCVCKDGKWTIVKGLDQDDYSKKLIAASVKELQGEKEAALA